MGPATELSREKQVLKDIAEGKLLSPERQSCAVRHATGHHRLGGDHQPRHQCRHACLPSKRYQSLCPVTDFDGITRLLDATYDIRRLRASGVVMAMMD
jgi:hypothetical protein